MGSGPPGRKEDLVQSNGKKRVGVCPLEMCVGVIDLRKGTFHTDSRVRANHTGKKGRLNAIPHSH